MLLTCMSYIDSIAQAWPLNLVAPDATHSKLILNDDNIATLLSAVSDRPVAVLSVVGRMHSGKRCIVNSFHMNVRHECCFQLFDDAAARRRQGLRHWLVRGAYNTRHLGTCDRLYRWFFFQFFFFVVVVLIVVYLSGGRGWQPEHHRARYRGTERAECLPHPHGTLQVSYCCDQTDKAYDSKVFSVTTLLSSLVLYNGVKIIDSEVLFLVVFL